MFNRARVTRRNRSGIGILRERGLRDMRGEGRGAGRWTAILPVRPVVRRSLQAVIAALVILLTGSPLVHAAGRAALVIDANTGEELHARDADRPLFPASLTKMMTLYIVFDLMEQKRVSSATKIQVTPRCAAQPPSNLDLGAGTAIPLRDAVLALIVKSANDVACAIGENLAGSEEKFAQLMTAKARQIGMRATTFRNASGLPDSAQVTTARDMSTLALRLAHDFPEHYKLFSTREFTFNGNTHRSHNGLLHGFEGTDGIKTGYTRASGFNLVSSVRRGQKHVIGVVMGGVTAAQRNSTMRGLLTQALGRAKAMTRPLLVRRPTQVAEPARVADKPPVPRRVAPSAPVAEPVAAAPIAPPVAIAAKPVVAEAAVAKTRVPPRAVAAAAPVQAAPSAAVATPAIARTATAAAGTGRPPATLQEQASGRVPVPSATPTPAATPVMASAASLPRPAGLGAKPSAPAAGATAKGPFHIQIGAFSNEAEAQRQLGAASERASAVLAGHAPLTLPVAKANMQFYRARFAGFSEAAAQSACQSLKSQKIECVVMRAE
jgi:D-alanyl-D-alanine carboxypeptidase